MIKPKINLSTEEYQKALSELAGYKLAEIQRKAVASGGAILVSETKKSLRGVTRKARSTYSNAKRGWQLKKKNGRVVGVRSLEEGVRHKVHQNGSEVLDKVNIMKDFRLKFFEKGTKKRTTKKGYNRGWFNSHHGGGTLFFSKAKIAAQNKIQSRIKEVVEKNIAKALQ